MPKICEPQIVEVCLQLEVVLTNHPNKWHIVSNGILNFYSPQSDSFTRSAGARFQTPINSVGLNRFQSNGAFVTVNGVNTPSFISSENFGTSPPVSVSIFRIVRADGLPFDSNQGLICRCSDDSCRVDCANAPDGFCCIDHAVINRLSQVLSF